MNFAFPCLINLVRKYRKLTENSKHNQVIYDESPNHHNFLLIMYVYNTNCLYFQSVYFRRTVVNFFLLHLFQNTTIYSMLFAFAFDNPIQYKDLYNFLLSSTVIEFIDFFCRFVLFHFIDGSQLAFTWKFQSLVFHGPEHTWKV